MPLVAFLGGWEFVLLIAVVLIVLGARKLPELLDGLRNGLKAIFDASQSMSEEAADPMSEHRFSLRVLIAQGFGVGRIPFAPGTFGSFLGLLWFALLVSTGNYWAYVVGCIEGIALSIWLCDDAEKIMGETDPGSVVLDEIIAIPLCFLPWVTGVWINNSELMPSVASFFSGRALWVSLALVALFRLFDIWKPWPVRQIQRLPGGWGVTADDVLASVYVALISLLFVL
jgi:phosphatidylglycerophosphatase A